MPNWKKLIVSGSDATLNSINVISTGSFGDDITITSGSFRVETFTEGLQFYNGTNYTSNRIILTSAQNMQFYAGGVFQFYRNLQLLGSKKAVFKNSVNDNSVSLLNTAGSGHSKLEIQDNSNNLLAFISSSGNVGIGTATSSQKLRVQGNFRVDSGYLLVSNGAGNTTEYLYHNPTSKAVELNVTSSNTTFDPQYLIRQDGVVKAQFGWDDDGGNELFIVNAANGPIQFKNSSTELARITNEGKLGLGTTSPDHRIHLSGSNVNIKLEGDGSAGAPITSIFMYRAGVRWSLLSGTGGANRFDIRDDANSASRFTLNSAGKLTLGAYGSGTHTGTATQRLAVDSSGNVIEVPIGAGAVDGSGAANKLAIWSDTDTLTSDSVLHWDTSNDRLGIGTDSPLQKLHLRSTSDTRAAITAHHASADASLDLLNTVDGKGWRLVHKNQNTFEIQHASSLSSNSIGSVNTYFHIGTTGNVGIGTTSPARALHAVHSDDTVALFESADTIARIEVKDDVNSSYFGTSNGTTFLGSSTSVGATENLKISADGEMAIGMNTSTQYGFAMRRNLTLADQGKLGFFVNFDLSGDTALSSDRTYAAYSVDMDSSATGGNQSQELILKGYTANVRSTGDANDVYGYYADVVSATSTANNIQNQFNGGFFRSLAQHSDGNIQNMRGVVGEVMLNGATSATAITNAHGVRGVVNINATSTTNVGNAYGGFFKTDFAPQTTGTSTVTGTAYGVYGEVESDSTTSLSNARSIAGFIDVNSGSLFENAYQFYGSTVVHSDATINNNWGIYSIGASKHRLDGKLGIGTSDPDRTLHVRHSDAVSSKFEGTSASGHLIDLVHDNAAAAYNGLRFFDRTTGRMHLTHIQTGTRGYIQIGNNWATGNEIFVVDGDNERVGIGTKTPSAQLHTTGNTLIGGYLRVQNVSSNHAIQIDSSTSGNARILAHNMNLNQDHKLDIEAEEIDLQAGSTSGGTLASVLKLTSASATFAGDVNVGGKLTAQEFHTEFVSASIIYDSGSTKFGDTHDDVHAFTGSVNIFSGSLSLTPAFQNVNGVLKIIHGPYAGSGISHIVAQNTGSQRHFDLTTDANNHTDLRLYRAGTVAVGFGTYWPSFIDNGGYSTRGGLIIGDDGFTNNYFGLKVNKGGISGSLNVADVLYVTGSTVSNVGIGTNAPEDKLEVMGDVRIRNQSGSNPADAGSLTFAETEGTYGSGLYGFRINQEGSNNRLHFQSSANTSTLDNILVIERDTGDIGINTNNPDEKLRVEGNIKAAGDFIGSALKLGFAGTANITTNDTNENLLINPNGSGDISMHTTSTGNVGIGIASPSHKLNVVGANNSTAVGIDIGSNAHYDFAANSTSNYTTTFNMDDTGLDIGHDSTSRALNLKTGGSDRLTILGNGNVGINVTSPDKRLKVNGQTQFYEYSGAHLTNNAHSTYNFDTLVSNSSATNGGGIGAYVKLAAGATNNSLGDFNAIRTRAYAENTTVNVGGLINFYAEYRNFTSTNSVTLSNHYGLKVDSLGVGGNATVTNNYGVYLNPGTAATNNFGIFQVGASVKNRFNGKVGIGEDPAVSLHVVSSDEVVAKFKSSDNKAVIEISDDDTTGYVSAENGRISIGPQQGLNVQNLNILTSNYKVGVGTSTPGRALHAYHATENEVLRLESGDAGAYVQFKDNNSDFQPAIGAVGNNLQFRASGSQVAKFDIDGNLKLGSDSGTVRTRLHLSGSTAADAGIRQSRDGVKIWTQEIDSNGKLQWAYRSSEGGSATQHFTLNDTGQAILHQYGSGNFTGTAAFNLQLDSSGNLIETAAGGAIDGSGTANDVVMWSDSNTLTDAPIAISGNNATFAGNVNANSGSFSHIGIGGSVQSNFLLDVHGPAVFRNTLYISDSIIHFGSNDFDIRTSGTSDIVFETSGTTERMRITDAGSIGIGTTSPVRKFHVEGNSGGNELFLAQDTNSTLGTKIGRFKQQDGTNNPFLDISSTSTGMLISTGFSTGIPGSFVLQSNGGSSYLAFNTNGANERMRINSSGNVGIGTTTPDHKLHVEFANTDTAFSGGGGGAWGSEGIRIENTSSTDNTMAMLHLRNSDADIHIAGIRQGTDDSDLGFFFEGNEKVRFTNAGKVGIGTNNPDVALHIESEDETVLRVERTAGSGFTAIDIKDGAGTTGNSAIRFSDTGGSPGEINYEHADNSLRISTNSSERIRIKSDGKVGIGTTNPSTDFHVNGEQLIQQVDTSTAHHGTLLIRSNVVAANSNHARSAFINLRGAAVSSNNVTNYDFVLGTHHTGDFIIARDNSFAGGYDSGSLKIDKDDLTVTVEKNLIVNEKLGIGLATPSTNLHVTGSEVRFEGTTQSTVNLRTTTNTKNNYIVGTSAGVIAIRANGNNNALVVKADQQIQGGGYGSGTFTGTATKTLQVDSSGNIIEGSIVNFAPKVEYQTVSSDIAANTTITLPNSLTYTTSSGGYEYLEVFIDGIRLMRNIDFQEISTSSIKLLMAVPATSVFTFKSIT